MKTVTIKLDDFEEQMLLLLAATYRAPPSLSHVVREAFIKECVRYGLDMKVMRAQARREMNV